MENAGVQNKQTGETPSVARTLWDPFGFMQMFGWGRSGEGPLFEVRETDDTYVCKVKVNLTLPGQADVAHAKAELSNGQLTLVVPKAAAAMREPESSTEPSAGAPQPESASQTRAGGAERESPPQSAAAPEAESPPRRTRRPKATGNGAGSGGRAPRRGGRSPARRGR
jgi:hypothetical protein